MKEQEKYFILNECKKHYINATGIRLINPYICLEELGRARALKEIIEKYIDCQPKKYYIIYQQIVKLENTFN